MKGSNTNCSICGKTLCGSDSGLCRVCYLERGPRFRGRRKNLVTHNRLVTNYGYMSIRVEKDDGLVGWFQEHRVIMERELGRKLKKGENVHHRDGNKRNNDVGNLEVWSHRQPPGIRAVDALDVARKIISGEIKNYRP